MKQFKAILAAEIIKPLDRQKLSVCAAQRLTGAAAADSSGIRNAELGRFTVDRLRAEMQIVTAPTSNEAFG